MSSSTSHSYLVAYPHPRIPPFKSIRSFQLKSDVVGDLLLEKLVDAYPQYSRDLKDVNTALWKASELPIKNVDNESRELVRKWISEREREGTLVRGYESLSDHFPGGPEKGELVHIVVLTPEIIEEIDELADLGHLKRMKERGQLSGAMKMASSPSESVKSPGAIKSAVERSSGPRYGRPSDRFGPPTALFSPPLARLRHRIEHSDAIPDRAVALATFSLIELSAGFYEDEIQREADLRILLKSLISGTSKWQTKIEDGSARPDGVWLLEGLAYLIVEIKNESGLGGDPFLQGLITYSKILAQEKYSVFIGQSNLPVVLLAIAGNRLTVSTAIFTDSIYADELLSIKLYFGTHASENVLHVARIFMAIDDCARELRDLYGGLINSNGPVPPAKFLWPEPTVVTSYPAEGIPKLEFISKVHRSQGTPINGPTMEEEDKRHAIYLAMIKPDDSKGSDMQVLVKFATRYHENAHRLLADHEPPLAPKLYSCTPVVGGMLMVVMEYIPQSEGASLHNHRPQESALQVIHQNISKALELLHGLDLVFGDLREQNVLYLPSKNHVLLVDFDGVGKHGEDRYSACLNETTSLGVRRLQIMEKLHDKENLERLVARLKR